MKNLFITALVAVFAFALPHSAKSSGHEEVEAITDAFLQAAEGATAIGLTSYGSGEYETDGGSGEQEGGAGFFLSLGGFVELGLAGFSEDTAGYSSGISDSVSVFYSSVMPRVNLGKGKIKKWGKHISLFGRLGTHLSQTDLEIPGANPSSHTNYDFNWHYGYGAEVVFGSDPVNSPFRLRLERVIYNFGEWETDPYMSGGRNFTSTISEQKRTYTGLSLIYSWGPWVEF